MCKAYNVPYSTFMRRLKDGCTLEQALTPNTFKVEFNGVIYDDEHKMCEALGVNYYTYRSRLRLSWDRTQAILGKKKIKRRNIKK